MTYRDKKIKLNTLKNSPQGFNHFAVQQNDEPVGNQLNESDLNKTMCGECPNEEIWRQQLARHDAQVWDRACPE